MKWGLIQKSPTFLAVGFHSFFHPYSEYSIGLPYGAISFGQDNRLNLFAGKFIPLDEKHESSPLLLAASLQARAGPHTRVMCELWHWQVTEREHHYDYQTYSSYYTEKKRSVIPMIVGVRFFGKQLAAELGLMYSLTGEWEGPIGFPLVNFVYNFGD
ncbi:MAG: hypothetical protein AB1393_09805 [Candidatus Edwardsbacteria bacterium]